jgi:hypothetical protein
MPYKVCRCGNKVGVRANTCSKCKFIFRKSIKQARPKIEKVAKFYQKGMKKCKCGLFIKKRLMECPSCHTIFDLHKHINWKELQRGNTIKVRGGPFWKTKDGTRLPMGYKGKFKVRKIEDDAILAIGLSGFNGFVYLYMGDKKISKYGTHLRPHKITGVKL